MTTETEETKNKIRAIVTFEIAGKPAEHIKKTLDNIIEQLKKEEHIEIKGCEVGEPQEIEDGFYSTFAEVEMIVSDLDILTYLSVNLTPASIEIISPDEFILEARELQNHYNDIISQMHSVSTTLRALQQKYKYLNQNFLALLQNTIMLILASGPKTTEQLSKAIGAELAELNKMLEFMKKENKITQENKKWILISHKK